MRRCDCSIPAQDEWMFYMSSQFLNHVRRNTRRNGPLQITSRSVLLLLVLVGMVASAIYWWGVQSTLTSNLYIAAAFTAILVLAPPTLISFLIPWSPAGMLLRKVNAETYGHAVVVMASIYLLYYSFQLQYSWWSAQPATAASGLVAQQVFIGLIGFILIPALLWAPVSSDELTTQVEQAQLVKRYELQTQADIAILRATLLRAQEKALIGFANLTVDEREELAGVMRSLVGGIDKTLREVGASVKTLSGAALPFNGMLDGNEDIGNVMDYIGESLTGSTLRVRTDHSVKLPPPAARVDPRDEARQLYDAYQRTPPDDAPSPSERAERAPSAYTQPHSAPATARVAPRQGDAARDGDYTVAFIAFGDGEAWTVRDLASVLKVAESTARERKIAWEDAGIVSGRGLSNGRYRFTVAESGT